MKSPCAECTEHRATNSRDRLCSWCRAELRYGRWIRRIRRRNLPTGGGTWATAWDPGITGTLAADRNRRWRRKVKGRKP